MVESVEIDKGWFEQFVKESVEGWRERNPVRENPTKVAGTVTGRRGERLLARRLRAAGYLAELSPGSRSPADVWGFALLQANVIHVPLIQVKTGARRAKRLTSEDETNLRDLATQVFDNFEDSAPKVLKSSPLFVSFGYAGVVLEPRPVVTAEVIGCHIEQSRELDETQIARFAETFYRGL